MATNIGLRRLLLFLILAGASPLLRAQDAGYFIDTESGESRFYQRLAWRGGEYALRYEVAIEMEAGGAYIAYLRESTQTPFIEVSLPPGRYRYQVTAYDILDRPEGVSRWENIEVRPAVQPEVFDMSPKFVSGDGEFSGYVLVISGHNIVPGAEFIIRHSDGTQIVPQALDIGEGGNARIFIGRDAPALGEYEIVVKNPGGLEARRGGIVFLQTETEVASESGMEGSGLMAPPLRQTLLIAGAGWAPVFPIHGDFFGENFSPAGAGIRFGPVFPAPRDLYTGAEFTIFLHANNGSADNDVSPNIMSVGANILAMKWLPNQVTALTFRLGASFFLLPDDQEKLTFNIGASYLWRFMGNFILEAGFAYAARIKENSFDGSIRPQIGAGIILNP